ncbi:MAG: hypothetical protein IJ539_05890 [Prevotella sp.]|nr:hypothetical protein [Prevotella sp.]MBR1651845.1 hypothetical protein [Alloprevotella sp.]
MSNKLKYYIISADDARRLGVTAYRQGNARKGYMVHSGDFACATEDFMERALEVTEKEAVEFVKALKDE